MTEAMSNHEYLRETATLMRERAKAACPSPWRHGEHATLGPNEIWGDDDGWNASSVATTRTRLNPEGTTHSDADAEHIVSWHPDVAMAVAALLDAIAWTWKLDPDLQSRVGGAELLALTRKYRGDA